MAEITRILTENINRQISLLSPLQRVFVAWLKIFNQFAICREQMKRDNRSTVAVQVFQNGRTIVSDETFLALCARKKRLQRKMTNGYFSLNDF